MRRGRFTEERIIGILKEREGGRKAADVRRRRAGSARRPSATGRPSNGGLEVSEAKRLKALEDENARLKKLLAEAMPDARAPLGVSERRACQALVADRSSVRYRSRRPDDGMVRERPRALSRERRRFGYDHEPRLRDHRLAEDLGFSSVSDFREIFEPHVTALKRSGTPTKVFKGTSGRRSRPIRSWAFIAASVRAPAGEVARRITGTRWNGPRFFGMRPDKTEAGHVAA